MRKYIASCLLPFVLSAGFAAAVFAIDKTGAKDFADTPEKKNRKLTVEAVYAILGEPDDVYGRKGEEGHYWDEIWCGEDWHLVIQFNPKRKVEHVNWFERPYRSQKEIEAEELTRRKKELEDMEGVARTLEAMSWRWQVSPVNPPTGVIVLERRFLFKAKVLETRIKEDSLYKLKWYCVVFNSGEAVEFGCSYEPGTLVYVYEERWSDSPNDWLVTTWLKPKEIFKIPQ
jgi:hypothetical protein